MKRQGTYGIKYAVVNERVGSAEHRILRLEQIAAENHDQNRNVSELINELKHINNSLTNHEKRLTELEKVPVQRLDQVKSAIITALSSAVIASAVSALFSLII